MTAPSRPRAHRARRLATAVVVAGSLVLAGACSAADDPDPAAGGSAEPVAEPSTEATVISSPSPSYLPAPEGVALTEPGTELGLDERAVVAWQPRQDLVGVLDVKVEELLKTTLEESFEGWRLDEQVTEPRPYFVTASVRNVGETDLGGQRVPLYVVDARDRLIESSRFADEFAPCPSEPFPEPFEPGDQVDVCLVYLVPGAGRLMAVSFRPDESFNPITWAGDVLPLSKREEPPGQQDSQQDSRQDRAKGGRQGGSRR